MSQSFNQIQINTDYVFKKSNKQYLVSLRQVGQTYFIYREWNVPEKNKTFSKEDKYIKFSEAIQKFKYITDERQQHGYNLVSPSIIPTINVELAKSKDKDVDPRHVVKIRKITGKDILNEINRRLKNKILFGKF